VLDLVDVKTSYSPSTKRVSKKSSPSIAVPSFTFPQNCAHPPSPFGAMGGKNKLPCFHVLLRLPSPSSFASSVKAFPKAS
jgi:hypothetical protein